MPTFTYVGRLDVEKKPSGSTPSAGRGSNRAAGASENGGFEKSGEVLRDVLMAAWKLFEAYHRGTPRSIAFALGPALHSAMMLWMRTLLATSLGLALVPDLGAQVPTRGDSVPVELAPVVVSVRRAGERLERLPGAVSVIDSTLLGGFRPALGADEILAGVPGLYVANRYNFSLDQRLSIRGFGARSNFGVRGIKIVLDGVPQTLPDGQTQLTNVDWGSLGRVEVLRGPGSLYGNSSGGVIALESERAGAGPIAGTVKVHAGSFGLLRWLGSTSGRVGRLGLAGSAGGFSTDGFRQHSAARAIQLSGRAQYLLSDRTTIALQAAHADAPEAQNPGALTVGELAARRDSAAANNILRRADKNADQQQVAATFAHRGEGLDIDVAAFGLRRALDNPLATATWVGIDRLAGGGRAVATWALAGRRHAPRLTAGVDVQEMRDDRTNHLTISGERTDSLILDQRERVAERGAFVQGTWPLTERWLVSAGARRDAVSFRVVDRHFGDGVDNSGRRVLSAWSANAGASLRIGRTTGYVTVATAFETPTTTELANAPGVSGGFNAELGPQRTWSAEIGARGVAAGAAWSVAGFLGRVSDAIVQFEEVGGRAFFRNAGRLHQDGIELAAARALARAVDFRASYTWARYRYGEYRPATPGGADTLDGNRVPGVPEHFLRAAVSVRALGATAVIEQALASNVFADDRNTIGVDGWGATDVAVSWEARVGGLVVRPGAGIRNLLGQEYVGSVTVNGAFGRVFEPAPGRNAWVGLELRFERQVRASSPGPGL